MTRKSKAKKNARILSSLEQELGDKINHRADPEEVAEKFNKSSVRVLRKYKINPVFLGEYQIDPNNTNRLLLYKSEGFGCSPIPFNPKISIIARALLTGEHQHIPDITKDPSHWECDPKAMHEEVYPIFSAPYTSGPLTGYSLAVAAIDIDFPEKYTFNKRESQELGRIVLPYGKLMFPDEPEFNLKPRSRIYMPKSINQARRSA